MKTIGELREQIAKIKSDERFRLPPATVQVNAPLALLQVDMAAKVGTLRWVLGESLQADDRVGPVAP